MLNAASLPRGCRWGQTIAAHFNNLGSGRKCVKFTEYRAQSPFLYRRQCSLSHFREFRSRLPGGLSGRKKIRSDLHTRARGP